MAQCDSLVEPGWFLLHVGELSFIGRRHYTGFSGEILGRYVSK